ncbi:hypothetical protein ACFL1X_01210 [Candidatus Hydrogenedentota bacterium]
MKSSESDPNSCLWKKAADILDSDGMIGGFLTGLSFLPVLAIGLVSRYVAALCAVILAVVWLWISRHVKKTRLASLPETPDEVFSKALISTKDLDETRLRFFVWARHIIASELNIPTSHVPADMSLDRFLGHLVGVWGAVHIGHTIVLDRIALIHEEMELVPSECEACETVADLTTILAEALFTAIQRGRRQLIMDIFDVEEPTDSL